MNLNGSGKKSSFLGSPEKKSIQEPVQPIKKKRSFMRVNIFKNKNWIDLIYGDELKVSTDKKQNSFFKNR